MKKSLSIKEALIKLAACIDKAPLTKKVALRIARNAHGLHPYRCRFCHEWHVGNQVGKSDQGKLRKRLNKAKDDYLMQ